MKKLLAILLALMLVMVSAFALAEGDPDVNTETTTQGGDTQNDATPATGSSNSQVTPLAPQTVPFKKVYTVEGTGAVNAADTLTFTQIGKHVENATSGVTAPDVGVASVTVDSDASEATINFALPQYTAVGEYYYEFAENDTGVAGVTYLADHIFLKVQVIQGNNNALSLGSATFRLGSETAAQKVTEFTNTYEAGQLTVSKTVDGNLGDHDKDWNFTVVFTAPAGDTVVGDITATAEGATAPDTITGNWTETKTATFVLKHGQSVTFTNIPKGVTYTIAEAEANADGYTTTATMNGEAAEVNLSGSIEGHEDDVAAYVNAKTITIDTGVTLETTAYMLIMALTMAGFAMMVIRRRKEY
jgi:pilin isopeptide linkage protein